RTRSDTKNSPTTSGSDGRPRSRKANAASSPRARSRGREAEPVPAGEPIRDDERRAIDEAVEAAERTSGYAFSVLIGDSGEDPRAFAVAQHARLADPDRSVLVLVDPRAR